MDACETVTFSRFGKYYSRRKFYFGVRVKDVHINQDNKYH